MKKWAIAALAACCLSFFPFVFPCQAEESGDAPIFRLKIGVEQDCLTAAGNENWRQNAIALIEQVNREFQSRRVKIRLEIAEVFFWQIGENAKTLSQALDYLAEKHPAEGCDMVIGLVSEKFFPECNAGGYFKLPKHIIARDYAEFNRREEKTSPGWTTLILMHEIGHYFGLEHSDNPKSIMGRHYLGDEFSEEEIEAINKEARKMKSGAPLK